MALKKTSKYEGIVSYMWYLSWAPSVILLSKVRITVIRPIMHTIVRINTYVGAHRGQSLFRWWRWWSSQRKRKWKWIQRQSLQRSGRTSTWSQRRHNLLRHKSRLDNPRTWTQEKLEWAKYTNIPISSHNPYPWRRLICSWSLYSWCTTVLQCPGLRKGTNKSYHPHPNRSPCRCSWFTVISIAVILDWNSRWLTVFRSLLE